MGTLRDEAYEKLDYLSQLTEVVIGPQNEVLARIPDRIELSFEQVRRFKDRTWGTRAGFQIGIERILGNVLSTSDSAYIDDIKKHFDFEVTPDFQYDLANGTMTGTITLIKIAQQVDEKKLLEIAIDKSCRILSHYEWPAKRLRDKISTVLNVFEPGSGLEWAKKLDGKAGWAGQAAIKAALSSAILENKWRIRDANVIIKVGSWINSYLSDDSDSSTGLVNLLKLKIMIDKDLPIYSVDEVF